MKYLIVILIALFAALIGLNLLMSTRNNASLSDYKRYNDSLSHQIMDLERLNRKTDDTIWIHETNIKRITEHHYHEKINIINLSNDSQFILLRNNITRYTYLLDTARR